MDKKSILIGALSASLLFVTLGAGINQNESSDFEWQPVELYSKIDETEITSHSIHRFEVLYKRFDVESNKWKFKIEDEIYFEPKE